MRCRESRLLTLGDVIQRPTYAVPSVLHDGQPQISDASAANSKNDMHRATTGTNMPNRDSALPHIS